MKVVSEGKEGGKEDEADLRRIEDNNGYLDEQTPAWKRRQDE